MLNRKASRGSGNVLKAYSEKNKQDSSLFFGVYYNTKVYRSISHPEEIYYFISI